MNKIIKLLQQKNLVWHATEEKQINDVIPSGYRDLDDKLNGGFPQIGVIDIQTPVGIGELRLLLPSIKQQSKDRLTVFIQPPGFINAEHLCHQGLDLNNILIIYPNSAKEGLWASEQCLKSGACSAVLFWCQSLEVHQVRRFQVAAELGQALLFLLKEDDNNTLSTPVSLSIQLSAHPFGIQASVPKRRGGWPLPEFVVDMSCYWPALTINKPSTNVLLFPTDKAV